MRIVENFEEIGEAPKVHCLHLRAHRQVIGIAYAVEILNIHYRFNRRE